MTTEDLLIWESVARRGPHLALLFGDTWIALSNLWLHQGALFHQVDRIF